MAGPNQDLKKIIKHAYIVTYCDVVIGRSMTSEVDPPNRCSTTLLYVTMWEVLNYFLSVSLRFFSDCIAYTRHVIKMSKNSKVLYFIC